MDLLPIVEARGEIARILAAANRLVLTAPTGAGKSTQVPQFLLDDCGVEGRTLVLQPRRLAARMLAQRVAQERDGRLGDEIGFQTRFERAVSPHTRATFITEGILLRMLQSSSTLRGIGAVVFDEFHERSLTADVGLALVKQLQAGPRPDLKLVVMSATLQSELVRQYLGDCPALDVPGRLFPVDVNYLQRPLRRDVWDEAAAALREVTAGEGAGDVLIFMPGGYEIRRTMEACRNARLGEPVALMPLYGDLSPAQQQSVMEPQGRRKVIVATNIAETSLTIPGVRHVIDSGLARINRFDSGRGVNMLVTETISRSSADQRSGRGGREGAGTCRRLWTLGEHQRRPSQTDPEVRRVDLAEVVLTLASLGVADPMAFDWIEPPVERALSAALALLHRLGALATETGELTPWGELLARLPVHPRLGVLLTLAGRQGFGSEAARVAAILSERPLLLGGKSRGRLRKAVPNTFSPSPGQPESDFFALLNALDRARSANFAIDVCDQMGISASVARQVFRTAEHLERTVPRPDRAEGVSPGTSECLIKAFLAGFPDHLARRRDGGSLSCDLSGGRRADLAREATVRDARLIVAGEVRDVGGGKGGPTTLLTNVSEVREDWLLELFPDDWDEEDETSWDARNRQVVRRRRMTCLGLVLDEEDVADIDPDRAAEILAERIEAGELRLGGWDKTVDDWIARTRWVAEMFSERGLPTYDDTDIAVIYREICSGATRYRDIKKRACLDYVRNAMSWDDQQFVESMAPAQIKLPCGRRMRISYQAGQPAKGKARIQDLYDVNESPKVAGGRQTVLLEILAPNMRTVQITDDLARFWREHYPAARKEFSRRYPKHEWR